MAGTVQFEGGSKRGDTSPELKDGGVKGDGSMALENRCDAVERDLQFHGASLPDCLSA